jgi:hypothetical protein
MMDKPLKNCSIDSCLICDIHSKIVCHFKFRYLLRFYSIALPSFIIGGIEIYNYSIKGFIIWLLIIGGFFLIVEIRVLCAHCPHYDESSVLLRCWANYGAPKLWRYRPGPMHIIEKSILISGFVIIWGYPIIYISFLEHWIIFSMYLLSVILFFALLRKYFCKKCINFTCPLNKVDIEIKNEFLKKSQD